MIEDYKNIKVTCTLNKQQYAILEKYAKIEGRSLSNMIGRMVLTYEEIHKQKY